MLALRSVTDLESFTISVAPRGLLYRAQCSKGGCGYSFSACGRTMGFSENWRWVCSYTGGDRYSFSMFYRIPHTSAPHGRDPLEHRDPPLDSLDDLETIAVDELGWCREQALYRARGLGLVPSYTLLFFTRRLMPQPRELLLRSQH